MGSGTWKAVGAGGQAFGAVAIAVALAASGVGWVGGAIAPKPAAFRAELSTFPHRTIARVPAKLTFTIRDSRGRAVRVLQFVHERPLHLIVVSSDLSSFDHIHPEPDVGDAYSVTHTFAHGGTYRLFADYTPPGSGTLVEPFDVKVEGAAPEPRPLLPDRVLTHTVDGVRVTLGFSGPLEVDRDILLTASFADSATGGPIRDLELYLGALAHVILVSSDLGEFIHAHPLETGEVFDPSQSAAMQHTHDPAKLAKVLVGPSPSTLRAATSFPRAGLYKLWLQFQRAGNVSTVPFVVRVTGAQPVASRPRPATPSRAISISVGSSGYWPARVDLPRNRPAVLAFTRPAAGNCGGTLVIPGLGVRRELPVGETVLVRFTPRDSTDYPFKCGMGMYQGVIAVR